MSIKVIKSDVPQPLANYSEASLANGLVFAAGQLASDFKTGVPQEARKHPAAHPEVIVTSGETGLGMDRLRAAVLEAALI